MKKIAILALSLILFAGHFMVSQPEPLTAAPTAALYCADFDFVLECI